MELKLIKQMLIERKEVEVKKPKPSLKSLFKKK